MDNDSRCNPLLVDVTLREGGYLNGFSFSVQHACSIVKAMHAAGVPFVEVGYFSGEGGSRSCSLQYLETVRESCGPEVRIAVMTTPGETAPDAYRKLAAVGVDIARIPCVPGKVADIESHVYTARAAGLIVSINLTHISEHSTCELLRAARHAETLRPHWLYLADSNGALLPNRTAEIFSTLKQSVKLPLGFHPHDGMSLALANSLQAIEQGASLVDASLGGMGKGGNLAIELIAMYLNAYSGATFGLMEMAAAVENYVVPCLGDSCLKRFEQGLASSMNLNYRRLLNLKQDSDCKGRLLDLLLNYRVEAALPQESQITIGSGQYRER